MKNTEQETWQETGQEAEQEDEVPILAALERYADSNQQRFHMPGHKAVGISQEWLRCMGRRALELDLTEIGDLDDFHAPAGVIAQAQDLAARLMGAETCRFLPNSSTSGVIASIMSCCRRPGEEVIIPRHAHKSAFAGLALSQARPVYVLPRLHERFGMPLGVGLEDYRAAIKAHPNAKAVMAIHPTFHGFCTDMRALASLCREAGMTLIVDEAHGSHISFSEQFPASALACGADIVIQSWHKTLGSLTQTAVLLCRRKNPLINDYISLITTTSPSYLLMASLDSTRAYWQKQGKEIAAELVRLSLLARESLRKIPGILVLDREHLSSPAMDLDISRLVLANDWGMSGYEMGKRLEALGVVAEMAEERAVTLMLTLGDREENIRALIAACRKLAEGQTPCAHKEPLFRQPEAPLLRLLPCEAMRGDFESVPLENAEGRVAGEMIIPYPPGIPLVSPGEIITPGILDPLRRVTRGGGRIQGMHDLSLRTVRVIR